MNDNEGLERISGQLISAASDKSVFSLVFGTCIIKVFTNSENLAEKLKKYFAPFITDSDKHDMSVHAYDGPVPDFGVKFRVKQPDPGKNKIKEEYADIQGGRIVRKVLTGMHFIFGGQINIAAGPCMANDNQVINFINNRYIEWMLKRGSLLFHSSGIIKNGGGVLISGFSGAGKSTLALHAMRKKLSFLSNDRVMASLNGTRVTAYGVPKLPRINPGTILTNPELTDMLEPEERERLMKLPKEELWELEDKHDVYIDSVFGPDRFILQCDMKGLVILNWKRDMNAGRVIVRRVNIEERPDLMPAFVKSPGLFFTDDGKEYDFGNQAYVKLLKNVEVLEISGCVDFDVATETLLKFF